jgi:hypothetical protein
MDLKHASAFLECKPPRSTPAKILFRFLSDKGETDA